LREIWTDAIEGVGPRGGERMKKHMIVMIPPGFSRGVPGRYIPEDAEIIPGVTYASLVGIMLADGTVCPGILSEDKTFVIEDINSETLRNRELLGFLEKGTVYRQFAHGHIAYNINAKLIFCTQPFEPSMEIMRIFDIKYWVPEVYKLQEVKQ